MPVICDPSTAGIFALLSNCNNWLADVPDAKVDAVPNPKLLLAVLELPKSDKLLLEAKALSAKVPWADVANAEASDDAAVPKFLEGVVA